MKLQIIYSHEFGQTIANFHLQSEVIASIIATKEAFIDYCLKALKIRYEFADSSVGDYFKKPIDKEVPKVTKLSGCVCTREGEEFNDDYQWWNEANGKVYFPEVVEEIMRGNN